MKDRIPDKVVITCTPSGFTIAVLSGEDVIEVEINKFLARGRSRPVKEIDWFEVLPDDNELADEIDGVNTSVFSIAHQLREIQEMYGAPQEEDAE